MEEANGLSAAKKRNTPRDTPKIPKKITESYLTNSGKFYLERFPASTAQFKTVMTRKIRKSCKAHADQNLESCMAMLDKVAENFIRAGFLNDEGYAKGLARSLSARGWPKKRIQMKLKEKGVPAAQIETVFENEDHRPDLLQALVFIRRKKLGAYLTKDTTPEKQLAAMARAGFDYETASRTLKMDKQQIEELLSA